MPDVSSVGAVDYAQQYQPQYATNDVQIPEQYEAYPAYDPAMEQPRSSGGGFWGYAGVGVLAALAGGLIGKRYGGKTANAAKELVEAELTALKNSEAIKNYQGLKTAAEEVVSESNKTKEWKWFDPRKWINKIWSNTCKPKSEESIKSEFVKDKFKPFVDVESKSEKATKEAKDAKKAKDKTKGADKKD